MNNLEAKPVVKTTMKTAIRTPYDVPLGLLKRSMISERVAMLKLTKHCSLKEIFNATKALLFATRCAMSYHKY